VQHLQPSVGQHHPAHPLPGGGAHRAEAADDVPGPAAEHHVQVGDVVPDPVRQQRAAAGDDEVGPRQPEPAQFDDERMAADGLPCHPRALSPSSTRTTAATRRANPMLLMEPMRKYSAKRFWLLFNSGKRASALIPTTTATASGCPATAKAYVMDRSN